VRASAPKQLWRGIVGPLQIIQKERRWTSRSDLGECLSDRLEQRGPITGRGWRAELGEQHGEVCSQRTFDNGLAPGSQVGAQGFHDRPEG
jgi:hypothetical protein